MRSTQRLSAGEPSAAVAQRVAAARERAAARSGALGWTVNAQASGRWLREHTDATAMAPALRGLDRGALTARGLDRALRLAWTIADLAERAQPDADDVLRALSLRNRGAAV